MNDLTLLKINYIYGNGFIRESAENTIRKNIHDLTLKIIKYKNHLELVEEYTNLRNEFYDILGENKKLRLIQGGVKWKYKL